jgi:hypothetical protein
LWWIIYNQNLCGLLHFEMIVWPFSFLHTAHKTQSNEPRGAISWLVLQVVDVDDDVLHFAVNKRASQARMQSICFPPMFRYALRTCELARIAFNVDFCTHFSSLTLTRCLKWCVLLIIYNIFFLHAFELAKEIINIYFFYMKILSTFRDVSEAQTST